jgi:methyl-accepting chemotaxis protein
LTPFKEDVSASIEQLTSISSDISGIVETIGDFSSHMATSSETVAAGTKNNAAMVNDLVDVVDDLRLAGNQLETSISFFHI